jgi:hypothetical protein
MNRALETFTSDALYETSFQKYKQSDGLATSSILAKTYIQHMEHKQIYTILTKNKQLHAIKMSMIYDQNKTNLEHTQRIQQTTTIYKIHSRKRTTRIHKFSDLTIQRKGRNLKFLINRKPI